MDHPPWAKAKTSHLPLPESHPNSARLTARHQFTQAFLLITGALPAKRLIANGLALDISLAPGVRPQRCTDGDEGFSFQYLRFPAGQSARLRSEARIWNPCGIPWSCDSEPMRFLS